MEDRELENRIECLVAWLVDEDAFVGDGSDDVVVDEVIDQRMGSPLVDIRYHHAGSILILCDEFRFKPFVVG
ncbi:hypothetical protein C498_09866 [Haloferax volcanii DS2]|uniref:Uncharacterized protein n=1 Tax=Haloferax volcanii (strain ATCC 29605 / DSM 3757 / JCM 8879 / NBRC 14742 / NCIMB 2012 / VKM B-1768 / DS2) TaxID=309800 RepID=L9V3G3_HALVD|nr:hypothetical protein C498_09866 [Haloferax volcanii DS2]